MQETSQASSKSLTTENELNATDVPTRDPALDEYSLANIGNTTLFARASTASAYFE